MTPPATTCPNCGAPVTFQWSSAVQTVCAYCQSVIVRHDVDLQALGTVADLPDDASPIQIGTEGRVDGLAFAVTGRIVYAHDGGGWNEWHLAFANGESGWLSDAQAEYAVSRRYAGDPVALPAADRIQRGGTLMLSGTLYQVTTITRARYAGVEGELPFEYCGKTTIAFADLRAAGGRFATIDYSEQPPLVYTGRFVEYDELALRHVRTFDGW